MNSTPSELAGNYDPDTIVTILDLGENADIKIDFEKDPAPVFQYVLSLYVAQNMTLENPKHSYVRPSKSEHGNQQPIRPETREARWSWLPGVWEWCKNLRGRAKLVLEL